MAQKSPLVRSDRKCDRTLVTAGCGSACVRGVPSERGAASPFCLKKSTMTSVASISRLTISNILGKCAREPRRPASPAAVPGAAQLVQHDRAAAASNLCRRTEVPSLGRSGSGSRSPRRNRLPGRRCSPCPGSTIRGRRRRARAGARRRDACRRPVAAGSGHARIVAAQNAKWAGTGFEAGNATTALPAGSPSPPRTRETCPSSRMPPAAPSCRYWRCRR